MTNDVLVSRGFLLRRTNQVDSGPLMRDTTRVIEGGDAARTSDERLLKLLLSVIPWIIIGGLLWAGLFVKPAPVGNTVQPPVLEKRDYFFGLVKAAPDQVWLAGSSGKIVKVGKDGHAERLATVTDKTFQDIAIWDAQRAVAVGNDGVIAVSADGGASWPLVENVPRSQIANKLVRVRAAAGGLAVAVGEMGAVVATRDYGKTWARLRPEQDVGWNDIAILPNDRFVLVGEFGKMAASSNGGMTWSDLPPPVKSSLMSVAFRDDGMLGVAVGLEGVVLVTDNGGQRWDKVDSGAHDHLFDVAWDAAGKRWVGAGSLGRWVKADAEARNWGTGRLNARDLSWHTRVVPSEHGIWFTGANIGIWDGNDKWQPLGDSWQLRALFSLPVTRPKQTTP